MTTRELVDLLEHAFDGDPWHGPSLMAVLRRVEPERAAMRPLAARHSIWEILLHVTSWTREVERRVREGQAGAPADGDWPEVRATDNAAWQQALASLAEAHRNLVATVAAQPDARWEEQVGDSRDPAAGTGVTYGVMVAGLATHHAYHAGQIALLA
ncbi:MAG TPA: DinB family protein [Vicinamibacterales bacterium]